MDSMSPVETLREIRANFEAMKNELEDTIAAGLRDAKLALAYKAELEAARAIILDLVKTIDASVYGEDSLHHHTCPAPDHGKCTCGAYEAMNAARQEEYKGAK